MSDEQHEIIEYDIHELAKKTKGDKTALGDAVRARTFPTGSYNLTCHPDYSITANMTAERNAGRPEIALRFDQEEGQPFFLRISPDQSKAYDEDGEVIYKKDDDGNEMDEPEVFSDAKHKNYSRFVIACNQQGEEYDISDLVDAMVNTTFTFKLVEYVGDMKVGDLPSAKDRDYHMAQGRGELEEVFYRIKDDEELRGKVLALGYEPRNYVESIRMA